MWSYLCMRPIRRAADRRTQSRQLSRKASVEKATIVKPGSYETADESAVYYNHLNNCPSYPKSKSSVPLLNEFIQQGFLSSVLILSPLEIPSFFCSQPISVIIRFLIPLARIFQHFDSYSAFSVGAHGNGIPVPI